MKRIVAAALVVVLLVLSGGCKSLGGLFSKKGDKKLTEAMATYLNERVFPEVSGYVVQDLDDDGVDDLLTCSYDFDANHVVNSYTLTYVKEENGQAVEADSLNVSPETFSAYGAFYTGGPIDEHQGNGYFETCVNDEGYISGYFSTCLNNDPKMHYLIFGVRDGVISILAHLFDPGASTGRALYRYTEESDLFSEENRIYEADASSTGIADAYVDALNKALEQYGFLWEKCKGSEQWHGMRVAQRGGVQQVLLYENTKGDGGEQTAPAAAELKYEIKKVNFEHRASNGELVRTNEISYPVFEGDSPAEKAINAHFAQIVAENESIDVSDLDETYRTFSEMDQQYRLPQFFNVRAEVTYNKNGLISYEEYAESWEGGVHPYLYPDAKVYEVASGEEKSYRDFLGVPLSEALAQMRPVFRENISATFGPDNDEDFASLLDEVPFNLTQEGGMFHYYGSAATPDMQVSFPFGAAEPLLFGGGAADGSSGDGAFTEQALAALFRKANDFYIGWLEHGPQLTDNFELEVEVSGQQYLPVADPTYKSVDEITNAAKTMFTSELYAPRIARLYTMQNSTLYAVVGSGEGGDVPASGYTLRIESQTATECTFSVTSIYEYGDPYTATNKLVKTGNDWLFTEPFRSVLYFSTEKLMNG